MEITYELRVDDYIAFNLHHVRQSPSQKRIYQWARIILPLVSGLIGYFVGTRIFHQSEIFWVPFSILLMIGLWFYYPKAYEQSIRKQIKRTLDEGDNSTLFGERKLVIGSDRIEIWSAHSTESLTRESIKKITELPDQIILYLSAMQGIIIPKRHLHPKTQQNLLKALTLFQNGGEGMGK